MRVTDYFEQELYPLAISIGMPSNEFWDSDPIYLLSYIKASERVSELKSRNIDYNSWLIGVYCETAFASVISNAFSKSSGKNGYPKQPFSFKKMGSDEDRLNAQYTQFFALSKNINKKFKK